MRFHRRPQRLKRSRPLTAPLLSRLRIWLVAFGQHPIQQIIQVEVLRPFAEVCEIETIPLNCDHSEHVVPLLVGPLAS